MWGLTSQKIPMMQMVFELITVKGICSIGWYTVNNCRNYRNVQQCRYIVLTACLIFMFLIDTVIPYQVISCTLKIAVGFSGHLYNQKTYKYTVTIQRSVH